MTNLYDRQVALEWEGVSLGAQRAAEAAKERGLSSTQPGHVQTMRAVEALARAIDEHIQTVASKAGRAGRVSLQYLIHVLPEEAAYLTIRHAIDGAANGQALSRTAVLIGTALQNHIDLVNAAEQAPGLYRKVMEQVKQATTARHREGVLRHVVRKYGLAKLAWTESDKLHLGAKLIELFEQSSGLIRTQMDTVGRHKSRVSLRLTEETEAWFSDAAERMAAFAPVHLPMLVPPRPWTDPFHGGYLTRAIRGAFMIQSHSKGYLDEAKNVDMPKVYAAINAVQSTAWRVNRRVLDVMTEARAAGSRYASLFVESDEALPPRPAGVPEKVHPDTLPLDQKEALMDWKRETAEVHTENTKRASRRIAESQKLWVADKFKNEEAIYFPHYMDFRGRLYPYANFLNPQADDTGRALCEFAKGKPLGERGLMWLKVHIANLFGVDKVSFGDRVSWVESNLDRLLLVLVDPLEFMDKVGREADSPWCALAACFELAGALVAGDEFVSHLPIAMDGSCSGLQHYSAMLRDPLGGAAVNLVPADKPGDIYTEVAKRAQARVDRSADEAASVWKGGKVVRKIAKQPTMTLCYAATRFGMGGQIRKAVDGLGGAEYLPLSENLRQSCVYMAGIVWDAIGDTVVAAQQAMSFLKDVSKLASEADLPIRWTAPSGFPVEQAYREVTGQKVAVHYNGLRVRLTLAVDGSRLDRRRQANGVAPNFVHSLDAAHLVGTVVLADRMAVDDWNVLSWAVVHDSFGVHAADVDVLNVCIREAFVAQYTPDVLGRLRDEVVASLERVAPALALQVPEVPTPGTLDLAAVRQAEYFFA